MTQPPHDLASFLAQETNRLAEEYERMAPKVAEDPGTAGDQGEENWAVILRKWLPANFHVVTKGRLIATDGTMSGQVDVVVLSPSYPPALLNSKHYLSAGVLAAFECKRTVRPEHIVTAFKQSRLVKRTHKLNQEANAYSILCAPTLFGLLGHSHARFEESPAEKLNALIFKQVWELDFDPYDLPDFFCIANLGTWSLLKHLTPDLEKWDRVSPNPPWGGVAACYVGPREAPVQSQRFTPIGGFLQQLYAKLAWRERQLREMAHYFEGVGVRDPGIGGLTRIIPKERFPSWLSSSVRPGPMYDPRGLVF